MKHLYEIFEKFPDDSSLWRDSAVGAGTAQHKLIEMAKKSAHEFYAIDLTSGEVLRFDGRSEGSKRLAAAIKGLANENRSSHVP
jgi:hypothetical protein